MEALVTCVLTSTLYFCLRPTLTLFCVRHQRIEQHERLFLGSDYVLADELQQAREAVTECQTRLRNHEGDDQAAHAFQQAKATLRDFFVSVHHPTAVTTMYRRTESSLLSASCSLAL